MEERNYCVYKHTLPNGKRYIGQTCNDNPEYRFNDGKGYSSNVEFKQDIDKYGWGLIETVILRDNLTKQEAKYLEDLYIIIYRTRDPKLGYNKDGGEYEYLHHHVKHINKVPEQWKIG